MNNEIIRKILGVIRKANLAHNGGKMNPTIS